MLGAVRTQARTPIVSIPPRTDELTPEGARDWAAGVGLLETCMATHDTQTYVSFLPPHFSPHLVYLFADDACAAALHPRSRTSASQAMDWTRWGAPCRATGTSRAQSAYLIHNAYSCLGANSPDRPGAPAPYAARYMLRYPFTLSHSAERADV
jgi:hypothetical protein